MKKVLKVFSGSLKNKTKLLLCFLLSRSKSSLNFVKWLILFNFCTSFTPYIVYGALCSVTSLLPLSSHSSAVALLLPLSQTWATLMTQFVFSLNRVGFHYLFPLPECDSPRPGLPHPRFRTSPWLDLAFFFYRFVHRIVKNNSGKRNERENQRCRFLFSLLIPLVLWYKLKWRDLCMYIYEYTYMLYVLS